MFEKLDFGDDDQDKIIYSMIVSEKFLGQCIRKGLDPSLFSSKVRRGVLGEVVSFYHQYSKAPGWSIVDLIAQKLSRFKDSDADLEMYGAYLEKVIKLHGGEISEGYLLNQIDGFIKKRIVWRTTNRLVKLEDRFGVDPDKSLNLMREAIAEADSKLGRQVIESFLDDTAINEAMETVTKFGVPQLDRALGGGLKRGVYAVILGYTNVGKSWCIVHLAKMATRYGTVPIVVAVEMSNRLLKARLKMCYTGMTKEQLFRQNAEARDIIQDSMVKKSNVLLISDEEKSMSVDNLPSIVEEVRDKHSVDSRLILLDSADDLLPPAGQSYRSSIEKSTATHTWLKNYAKDNDICIVTTAQAQRGGEDKWWLTSKTIADDINKIRKATVGVSLNASPGEMAQGYCRLFLFKQTDGPVGAKVWVKQNYDIGQFIIDSGKYDRFQYWEMLKEVGAYDKEIWKSGARDKSGK